jgi:hypothetical protein
VTVQADVRFAIIPNWLIDQGSANAVKLYGVLWRFADYDTHDNCHPSRPSLAKIMGVSVDTIDRTLAELVELGAITVTKRERENGSSTSNDYTLHTAQMPSPSRTDAPTPSLTDAAPIPRVSSNQEVLSPPSSDLVAPAPKPRSPKQQERDGLAEALGAEWGGIPLKGEPTEGLFWKCVSGYLAMGFTPDQLARVHILYQQRHPTWEYTMPAVAKHAKRLIAHEHVQPVTAARDLSPATRAILNWKPKEDRHADQRYLPTGNADALWDHAEAHIIGAGVVPASGRVLGYAPPGAD